MLPHITYVTFTENCRRSHISTRRSTVAYTPVKSSGDKVGLRAKGKKPSFNQTDLLSVQRESPGKTFHRLSNNAIGGISAMTSDRAHLWDNTFIASNVVERP